MAPASPAAAAASTQTTVMRLLRHVSASMAYSGYGAGSQIQLPAASDVTVNKTKFLGPRPRPLEVNKGTRWI